MSVAISLELRFHSMSRNSPCLDRVGEGVYLCRIRNLRIVAKVLPVRCVCDSGGQFRIIGQSHPCPLAAVVSRITPHGIDRLQLCRESGCGKMVTENGVTRCFRLGTKCDSVNVWSAYLNGERECQHWE